MSQAIVVEKPAPPFLRRAEVARELGMSVIGLRRYEAIGICKPQRNDRGEAMYTLEMVETIRTRFKAYKAHRTRDNTMLDGEISAMIFCRFEAGDRPRSIVQDLKCHPEVVREALRYWDQLDSGSMRLEVGDLREIERTLGLRDGALKDARSVIGAIQDFAESMVPRKAAEQRQICRMCAVLRPAAPPLPAHVCGKCHATLVAEKAAAAGERILMKSLDDRQVKG